jgi:hypothetical protein
MIYVTRLLSKVVDKLREALKSTRKCRTTKSNSKQVLCNADDVMIGVNVSITRRAIQLNRCGDGPPRSENPS